MYNNALFKAKKNDTKGYTTREGKEIFYLADKGEKLYLFDCDFTETDYGIFKTELGVFAWFHRDDVEYLSGNVGVRAGETGFANQNKHND